MTYLIDQFWEKDKEKIIAQKVSVFCCFFLER